MTDSTLTAAQVLDFWLDADPQDAVAMQTRMQILFRVDPAFDAAVRRRCGGLVKRALNGELEQWASDARGTLALIVLLDQMPRNIFRGTARAFAGDAQALSHALAGFERGFDRELTVIERVFLHMPLEHAEDVELQQRCVASYEVLHAQAPAAFKEITAAALQAGIDHHALVARFGRFPHRNAVLGRPSTAAEAEWLRNNRTAWGQGVDDVVIEHDDA